MRVRRLPRYADGAVERDGRLYVIYPAGARPLYYVFRPVAYVDQALTGTGTHIGRHRPAAEAAR
ncbi:MAG TPA: hypothetical protein VFJ16_26320 [Longimicrobium sp.]|nr:hypothetical protein [Longimicrobium sp.]